MACSRLFFPYFPPISSIGGKLCVYSELLLVIIVSRINLMHAIHDRVRLGGKRRPFRPIFMLLFICRSTTFNDIGLEGPIPTSKLRGFINRWPMGVLIILVGQN